MRALLVVLLSCFCALAYPEIHALNFDFDDNLFVTDAKIHPKNPVKNEEATLSTADWSVARESVGKPGPWAGYVVDDATTFREVSDLTPVGIRLMADQIKQALDTKPEHWRGPAWKSFVRALKDPKTRPYTTLITARRHSRDGVQAGLQVLLDRGLIPALPDRENLYVVLDPALPAEFVAATVQERKAKVMLSLLDKADKQPLDASKGQKHLWGFSDDDFGNFQVAEETLAKEVVKRRWPHTKVVLAFTGLNHPIQKPHCTVLEQAGARNCTTTEEKDAFKAP